MVGRPKPPPLELFDVRRQLACLLIGHLKTEDWVLYPRLLVSPDKHIAATARAFIDEMGGMAAAYIGRTEKWSADVIAADWAGYCRDSRTLLEALSNRILRENRELYPLLESLDRVA